MANRPVFQTADSPHGFVPGVRDLAAVEDVAMFRALRTDQLLCLEWPRPSQRQYGEGRLRELFHHGWLNRTPLYDAPGPPRAIYTLGSIGRRHLRSRDADLSVGRERLRDVLFIGHWLFTNDCLISLRLGAEQTGGALVSLFDERGLRRLVRSSAREMEVIPDALAVIRLGDAVRSFAIEADRGTVDLRAWRSKVERYLRWTATRSYSAQFASPTVLTVIDGTKCDAERRLKELVKTTEETVGPGRDASLFLYCESGQLNPESAFRTPIWRVAGRPGLTRLGPRDGA
jgi:Replication-relaxation